MLLPHLQKHHSDRRLMDRGGSAVQGECRCLRPVRSKPPLDRSHREAVLWQSLRIADRWHIYQGKAIAAAPQTADPNGPP